jgi:hypothetical protein
MGFETDMGPIQYRFNDSEKAADTIQQVEAWAQNMLPRMLPNRELLNRIKKFGLQRI